MPSLSVSRGGLRRTVPVLAAFVVGAVAYAPLYCYPLLAPQSRLRSTCLASWGRCPGLYFLLVSALCSPILGRAFDVVADRRLLMLGAVLLAAGWFVASIASSVALSSWPLMGAPGDRYSARLRRHDHGDGSPILPAWRGWRGAWPMPGRGSGGARPAHRRGRDPGDRLAVHGDCLRRDLARGHSVSSGS